MIVLALDAAGGGFSAALVRDDRALGVRELSGNVALERGLGAVAGLLESAGVRHTEIDRLAVGIGPGSFTGVRIAISYAKSLALGWRRPLVGVNTFDARECGIVQPEQPLLTVVRGRTGVVSVRYRENGREYRASGYVNDVMNELPRKSGALAVLGDAEDVLPALAERGFIVNRLQRAIQPPALAVATVAATRVPAASAHEIRADYGELPAAKVPKL